MSNAICEAIQTISTFLSASVQTKAGVSLIQRLYDAIPSSWETPSPTLSRHAQIIVYSLDLLQTIHTASLTENTQLGIKDWRQVNALNEIILILGLYRVLSPGVGVLESRRLKSAFLTREGDTDLFSEDDRMHLLQSIISRLESIVSKGGEIGETIRRKLAVDILSGMVELSYNPLISESKRDEWECRYKKFLSRYIDPKLMLI